MIGIPKNRQVILHLLDGGVGADNRRELEEIANRCHGGCTIVFHPVSAQAMEGFLPGPGNSTMCYARIWMESLLADTDKVIYIDSDILVTGNLSDLWEFPMEGAAVMACRDRMVSTLGEDRPRPLEPHEDSLPYFNSGIFVADLAEWRRLKIQEQALAFITDPHCFYRWHDQTILNYLLRGRLRILDQTWNWQSNEVPGSGTQQVRIMHFTTPRKPWKFWDSDFRFRAWRGCYSLCCGSTWGMFLRNREFSGMAFGLFDGALERFPLLGSLYLGYLRLTLRLSNQSETAVLIQGKITWLTRSRTPVDRKHERALMRDFLGAIRRRLNH